MHTQFRSFARAAVYPALVCGFLGLALSLVDAFPAPLLPLLNLALAAVAMLVIAFLERVMPARRDWLAGRGDLFADCVQSFVILPLVAAAAQALDGALVPAALALPKTLPLLAQVAAALVVAELLFYLVHRASHAFGALWRLHEVHHGATRVYWANSGRFHPLDVALQFPIYFAPLFVLGLSPQAFSLFLVINAVTGLLEHANIDVRLGVLNFVFNGPELHRVHHEVGARVNYGKVLAVWDVVFGTHTTRVEAAAAALAPLQPGKPLAARRRLPGNTPEALVEVGAGVAVPTTLLGQLAHPFRNTARAAQVARTSSAAAAVVVAVVAAGVSGCATMPSPTDDAVLAHEASAHRERPTAVTLDSHSRPRCLAVSAQEGVFLKWDESDRYARSIEITRLPVPCSSWRDVIREDHRWSALPAAARSAAGVALSDDVVDALAKVRRGAREMQVPEQVEGFTLAQNVALTERYGHGITGALYAQELAARPGNAEARAAIVSVVEEELAMGDAAADSDVREKTGNLAVLVSMGFGWDSTVDEHTVGYVKDFLETVQQLGVDVDVLKRDPYGSLEGNTALLVPQLRKHLAAGQDVVLIGLSKGTPEMLAAAVDVLSLDKNGAQRTAPGSGRLVGVVNMSGMMDGLIFGDWAADHAALASVTSATLGAMPFWRSGFEISRYAWVLPRISTRSVRSFNTRNVLGRLPRDVAYLDVIGVVPDDGILKNDAGAMQPFIDMDRKYELAGAANDGFVRYPGNETPKGTSPRQYQLTVAGSHMLFDGSFAEHSLQDARVRRALMRAAVLFVTQQRTEAQTQQRPRDAE